MRITSRSLWDPRRRSALGGCVSTAGIASTAKQLAPESVGLDSPRHVAAPIAADWWRGFDEPALDALIERALAGNPTLKVAEARERRALAAVAGARAAGGPQLDASRGRSRASA